MYQEAMASWWFTMVNDDEKLINHPEALLTAVLIGCHGESMLHRHCAAVAWHYHWRSPRRVRPGEGLLGSWSQHPDGMSDPFQGVKGEVVSQKMGHPALFVDATITYPSLEVRTWMLITDGAKAVAASTVIYPFLGKSVVWHGGPCSLLNVPNMLGIVRQ